METTETKTQLQDHQVNPETKQVPEDPSKEKNQETPKAPSVEELMAQLAAQKVETEKYKNQYNKASSEAAESKKQLRSKQTAEEIEAAAKAEAERIKDEKLEAMSKELNHIKAVAAYKNVSEKSIETLIEAVSENDHAAIATIIENEVKAGITNAQAEWMKSRPRVNAGNTAYSGMTADQIMAIEDRSERRKAIALNPELFN